ncbi:MAG: tetratricopeptide repeat protein [Methanothrix sp.]|nr:tetratricopeptide repeat protein [Methanothrix sp.]
MQNITITVSEAGTAAARTFAYKILVEGNVMAERTLTPVQTQQVQEMASQYFALSQGAGQAGTNSYLSILSKGLFHLFLEAGWQDLKAMILPGGRLTIASTIPEVLQLPWELLSLYDRGSDGSSVIRLPRAADGLNAPMAALRPGPLRVLFLAAEPLDYEEEEQSILKASEGLDISLTICESGTMEELKSLAESFRPHLVHLAGQGKMSGGSAVFSLPGQSGRVDLRSAEELASALKDLSLAGIILSGRQSESASYLHLLCQRLAESIPLAVAWNAPTARILPLYRALAAGQSMDEALLSVRREIYAATASVPHLVSVPALYSIYDLPGVFDSQKRAAEPASLCRELSALPGLAEGRADCFVDRRRDLQRLLPALRDGGAQVLIITGRNGVGKSTLAVRLARMLAPAGYSILPIYSSPYNRISSARLLEAAISHLIGIGEAAAAKSLKDPKRSVRERLHSFMDLLKTSRILMIWDGLDLEGKTGKISEPDLAEFYLLMIKGMTAGRAIITCEALPADATTLPARALQWKLEGIGQAAFVRYLLQDEAVADRYKKGAISYAKLAMLHLATLGHPALLAQTGKALGLGEGDFAAVKDLLAILTTRLGPISNHALSLAAIYGIAMSPAGLAAISGLAEEQAAVFAREWQDLSLAYAVGKLWAVPSTLRAPLLSALSMQEQRAAQKAAGDFQRDLAEAGRSSELELSRLDVLLEARGHYLAAEDRESAVAITARISGYLQRRGYYSELIRLNQELLVKEMQSAAGPTAWIAEAYLDQGEYRKAEEWYGRALEIAPDAAAQHGLGTALMRQKKYDLARECLQKAKEAFHGAGDPSGEAASLSSLAAIDLSKSENEAAAEKLQTVLEIMKSLGDVQGEAAALQEMARLNLSKSDYDAARPMLVKSLELLEGAGDRTGAAFAIFNLASLDLEKGDFQSAGAEYAKALPLFKGMGDRAGEAAILHSLGMIHSQAGEKEKAMESFRTALQINQELADRPAEAGAFFQLGALAVQQDKVQEGLRLMALAAIVLRSIKSDEVKNVEPLVERLASQLSLSQEQFMVMVQEVLQSYVKDRGWGLVERAWGK